MSYEGLKSTALVKVPCCSCGVKVEKSVGRVRHMERWGIRHFCKPCIISTMQTNFNNYDAVDSVRRGIKEKGDLPEIRDSKRVSRIKRRVRF